MEVWVKVRDNPTYEVSSEGRVRNAKTGRIMKTQVNDRGYEHLSLRKNKSQVDARVHRLVADSFYDGDHDGFDVNHIDGDKLNNRVSNLEWCSHKENIEHAFRTGLKKPSRQIKIRVIETGEVYESIRACARAMGLDQSMICQSMIGKMRSVNGYHFERVRE